LTLRSIAIEDKTYIEKNFTTCKEDRPLFVQFCANDPDVLLKAAKLVEDRCDAVDINCGCPQGIAKKGHYGSFLLEEPDLIA
jgi:tRNA-dihydrouridine synthase 1